MALKATSIMRILQTIRQGEFGGGETHLFDLTTRLDRNEFSPVVLSFTDGNMVDKLREKNISTEVIPSKIPFDPRVILKVIRLLKKHEIDAIHAHGTRAYSNIFFAALFLNLPVIYTIHGWSFNDTKGLFVKFLRIKVESILTKFSKVNICVSNSNKQTGIKHIKNFSCEVIYNGVSFDKFNPDIVVQPDLKLPKKKNEIIIGLVARMSIQKDPITLIKAFENIIEDFPNVKLLMVGSGELEDEIANYIKKKQINHLVFRRPFSSRVAEYLKQIDVFCLPSLWEGLPIGVIEAMAMKRVIVATAVDGTTELIQNQTTGYLFEKGDVEELSSVLKHILENPKESEMVSKNGYQYAKENFNVESMVIKTQQVYSSIQSTY